MVSVLTDEVNTTDEQEIVLPHTDKPIIQRFKTIVQPLFQFYTTQIAPGRAKKPNNTVNQPNYDFKTVLRGVQDLLSTHSVQALASMNGGLEIALQDSLLVAKTRIDEEILANCPFCYQRILEETAGPKIVHDMIIDGGNERVVSFPNITSSGVLDYVTVFSGHKTTPLEITFRDMDNFMDSSYDLAGDFIRHDNINGMMEIINLGPKAGASQPHLHTRRKGLTKTMVVDQDHEVRILNSLRSKIGIDSIDEYLNKVISSRRDERNIYIFDNDYVVIFAPEAPRYTHEINIFLKRPRSNILELSSDERRYVGESMLGVFHFLFKELGVTDLNVETYQGRFDVPRGSSAMRLHYKIMPKNINGTHAGFEDGGLYTATKYPEETAAIGRRHYHTQ